MSSSTRQKKVAAKRRAVIGAMVASLKHGEPREYSVGLVGYYIEGLPYGLAGGVRALDAARRPARPDGT